MVNNAITPDLTISVFLKEYVYAKAGFQRIEQLLCLIQRPLIQRLTVAVKDLLYVVIRFCANRLFLSIF